MKLGGPTSKESVGADDDDKINKITKEYPLVMECDLKYTNNKNVPLRYHFVLDIVWKRMW